MSPDTPPQDQSRDVTGPAPSGATPDAAALLARMRTGDREAASDFLTAFGEQIRRRVRGKLGREMRRVFDSQEILSTVGRRLDRMVLEGHLRATEPPQLWALMIKMIDTAVLDKVRVFARLRAAEGEDSEFASAFTTRMRQREREEQAGAELELEAAFRCLRSDVDREVLTLWLNDTPHTQIAQQIDSTPDAVRQRWRAIRQHLHEQLTTGAI